MSTPSGIVDFGNMTAINGLGGGQYANGGVQIEGQCTVCRRKPVVDARSEIVGRRQRHGNRRATAARSTCLADIISQVLWIDVRRYRSSVLFCVDATAPVSLYGREQAPREKARVNYGAISDHQYMQVKRAVLIHIPANKIIVYCLRIDPKRIAIC